jgi:mono/diheme cytochrome c family protein
MFDLRLFLPKRVPMVLITVAIVLVTLSWLPFTMIAKSTLVPREKPRIHLFQDMDNQPKLQAQDASPIFRDGRAMRQPVTGTVARGGLQTDDDYVHGYTVARGDNNTLDPKYLVGFPADVDVDEYFLARGQLKFETFCAPCHGKSGYGNGPVNRSATRLAQGDGALSYNTSWAPSANLHLLDSEGRLTFGSELYPNGQLYNTINHGKGTMAGYGNAIDIDDRWSIVAYVRALQLSQNTDAARQAMDASNRQLQTAGLDAGESE